MDQPVRVSGSPLLALGKRVIAETRKNLQEIQAERQGKGRSHARRLRPFVELIAKDVVLPEGPPQPTDLLIKTHDGTAMRFFTDGSIRRAGRKMSRKEKRAAKQVRQATMLRSRHG